jgi:hypothetical protein
MNVSFDFHYVYVVLEFVRVQLATLAAEVVLLFDNTK